MGLSLCSLESNPFRKQTHKHSEFRDTINSPNEDTPTATPLITSSQIVPFEDTVTYEDHWLKSIHCVLEGNTSFSHWCLSLSSTSHSITLLGWPFLDGVEHGIVSEFPMPRNYIRGPLAWHSVMWDPVAVNGTVFKLPDSDTRWGPAGKKGKATPGLRALACQNESPVKVKLHRVYLLPLVRV